MRGMDLKTFIFKMPTGERDSFAEKVGTTKKHLQNVAYGYRTAAPELALAIEDQSGRMVTRQEVLPNTWQTIWPPKEVAHGQLAKNIKAANPVTAGQEG